MKWLRAVLEIMFMCSCTHILYIEAAETENTVSDTHVNETLKND